MKNIQKRAVGALLALALLLSSVLSGCGQTKDSADLQKVTLNEVAHSIV